jgi:hypothetical protein
METVQKALTKDTVGLITITELAQLIEAPVEKLQPLVEHKYLRVVMAKEPFERTVVARPGQRATEWLRMMFQPLKIRPLIPLREVGKLWKVTEHHVLKICRAYRIPVQHDPVFGYVMSFNSLKSFARARMKYYKPKGYGRAQLLRYFLSQIEGVRWKNPLPYSERLEREINRIAHLPEPLRTIRAMALYEAFRDARTAMECLRRGRQMSEEMLKSEASIEELCEKATGAQEWRTRSRPRRIDG